MEARPESMEKMLKEVESMCICEACPTYLGLGRTDDYIAYCFATREKQEHKRRSRLYLSILSRIRENEFYN